MPFLLLYWKWIALAAFIGALAVAYNVHVDKLIHTAVTKAVTERDGEWRKSEAEAIAKADAVARATEEAHATALKALRTKYEKEVADGKAKADAAIASVHAGYRLRIDAGCSGAGNDPQTPAAATGSDGPAGSGFLNEADSAFLLGEAKRADAVVNELHICQATVIEDRKEKP